MKDRMLQWFHEYGERLGLLLGVLLVAALSFEAGYFSHGMKSEGMITVTLAPVPIANVAPAVAGDAVVVSEIESGASPTKHTECPYIGSKNSNKYHLASCAVAKRIKPENRLCFASQTEAEKRGYVPSCLK